MRDSNSKQIPSSHACCVCTQYTCSSLYLFIFGSDIWIFLTFCLYTENVQLKVVEISNGRKHVTADSENVGYEEGQSSESVTNVCNSNGPLHDYESSDTSLKLGLVQHIQRGFYTSVSVFVCCYLSKKQINYFSPCKLRLTGLYCMKGLKCLSKPSSFFTARNCPCCNYDLLGNASKFYFGNHCLHEIIAVLASNEQAIN